MQFSQHQTGYFMQVTAPAQKENERKRRPRNVRRHVLCDDRRAVKALKAMREVSPCSKELARQDSKRNTRHWRLSKAAAAGTTIFAVEVSSSSRWASTSKQSSRTQQRLQTRAAQHRMDGTRSETRLVPCGAQWPFPSRARARPRLKRAQGYSRGPPPTTSRSHCLHLPGWHALMKRFVLLSGTLGQVHEDVPPCPSCQALRLPRLAGLLSGDSNCHIICSQMFAGEDIQEQPQTYKLGAGQQHLQRTAGGNLSS